MKKKEPAQSFFTKEHNALINLSSILKILAVFVFIIFAVKLVNTYKQMEETYEYRNTPRVCDTDNNYYVVDVANWPKVTPFLEMIRSTPVFAFSVGTELFAVLAEGLGIGVGLLGISSCLSIMVEIDLNYRLD